MVAMARGRRGRYEALRVDMGDGAPEDRWSLSGPHKGHPWTAGTLADVQRAADFVEAWKMGQTA